MRESTKICKKFSKKFKKSGYFIDFCFFDMIKYTYGPSGGGLSGEKTGLSSMRFYSAAEEVEK